MHVNNSHLCGQPSVNTDVDLTIYTHNIVSQDVTIKSEHRSLIIGSILQGWSLAVLQYLDQLL